MSSPSPSLIPGPGGSPGLESALTENMAPVLDILPLHLRGNVETQMKSQIKTLTDLADQGISGIACVTDQFKKTQSTALSSSSGFVNHARKLNDWRGRMVQLPEQLSSELLGSIAGQNQNQNQRLESTSSSSMSSRPSTAATAQFAGLSDLSPSRRQQIQNSLKISGRRVWGLCVLDDEKQHKLTVRLAVNRIATDVSSAPTSPATETRATENRVGEAARKKTHLRLMHADLRSTESSECSAASSLLQDIVLPKADITRTSFTAIGVPIETTLGIGILIGFRPGASTHADIHVVRYPLFSTTAYLNRDSLKRERHVCPELPVHTPYGMGVACRENKTYDSWTVKMTSTDTQFQCHLNEQRIRCDARFVPLVEAGKRKWKKKQLKTFALLEKLHKLAVDTGVVEKLNTTMEEIEIKKIVNTTKKAWEATTEIIEKQTTEIVTVADEVGNMLERDSKNFGGQQGLEKEKVEGKRDQGSHSAGDEDDAGEDGFLSAGDSDEEDSSIPPTSSAASGVNAVDKTGTAPVQTKGFVQGAITVAGAAAPANQKDVSDLNEFADASAGDEEILRLQAIAEKTAQKLQSDVNQKLAETNMVAEVEDLTTHLKQQGEKITTELSTFGEKALEELTKESEIQQAIKTMEVYKKDAEVRLQECGQIYEKSKLADVVEKSRIRLEEKMERLRLAVPQGGPQGQQPEGGGTSAEGGQEATGTSATALALTENLTKLTENLANNQAVWQQKGAALFGVLQRNYLAGPDGWIAKTRKKLQQVLKDDALGLREWDFATYTNSVLVEQQIKETADTLQTEAQSQAKDAIDTVAASTRERGKLAKKVVNSAAEQILQYAKPEESALELLIKLESMRGMEMLDAIDLQGILDKAGIQVPKQVANFFVETDHDSTSPGGGKNADTNVGSALKNLVSGETVLTKVLDDENLVLQTQNMVGHLETALDKVGVLAENKTVQSLLQNIGAGAGGGKNGGVLDSIMNPGTLMNPGDINQSFDNSMGSLMNRIENLDVEHAVESTEKLVADLQDPVKRGELINSMLDSAVDVVMGLLPKIHIENLEGESSGFHYAVGNIDLGGFKVRKEKVTLKINFETATAENLLNGFELVSFHAAGMSCILEKLSFSFEQQSFPYLNGEGSAMSFANNISLHLGFGVRWWKNVPQLYLTRREVDIASLELEIEESWFSAVYNVLIAAFSNLIKSYVCDSIEVQIDDHVDTVVHSLDGLLQHEIVKPWLASLAPPRKDKKKDKKVKLKEVKTIKDSPASTAAGTAATEADKDKSKLSKLPATPTIGAATPATPAADKSNADADADSSSDEDEILTVVHPDGSVTRRPKNKPLPLSSERAAEARAQKKAIEEAQKKIALAKKDEASSPEQKAANAANLESIKQRAMSVYEEYRRNSNSENKQRLTGDASTMEEFGAALAQMSVMRSVLKSLKAGKAVTRGQAQGGVFSAIYAVDDEEVKQCLNDVHAILVNQPAAGGSSGGNNSPGGSSRDSQNKSTASKVGGWVKGTLILK